MSYEPTLDEQVEALFPVDGPYGKEETKAAGRAIAALVRYLNHATWHDSATPYPSSVDSVTRSLTSALYGLDQLLRQLEQRLMAQYMGGRLYDDGGGDPAARVTEWRMATIQAQIGLAEAARALQAAASQSNHLGLRTDDEVQR